MLGRNQAPGDARCAPQRCCRRIGRGARGRGDVSRAARERARPRGALRRRRGRGSAARRSRAASSRCRGRSSPGSLPLATLATRIESRLSRDISVRARQQLHRPAPAGGRATAGSASTGRARARPAAGQLDQLAQRVDARAAAFDRQADRRRIVERSARSRAATSSTQTGWKRAVGAGERHHREDRLQRGEQVEEAVALAEDHRRPQHREVERRRRAAPLRRAPSSAGSGSARRPRRRGR